MTGPSTTTFRVAADDVARALDALAALGFELGSGRRVTTTRLDTVDGRLARAGLRLDLVDGARRELVLAGDDVVEVRIPAGAAPRFATDLPAGPLRERLAAIADVRALLPVVRVASTRTTATLRDADGRTVVVADVHDRLAVVDHDDADVPAATVAVHALVGSPRPARRAVDALAALGLDRSPTDTVSAVALAAGIDPAGVVHAATVPLDPAMPAIDGVRAVLAHLADTIEANRQGAIDDVDPEFLHDLRVAVRRTRAVLKHAKRVLPGAVVADGRARFARLGDLTGPARDLDVYLLEWDGYVGPLGADVARALLPIRERLEARRQAAHADLVGALDSPDGRAVIADWRRALAGIDGHDPAGDHADRALGRVVARRISAAQRTVVEGGRAIGSDSPATDLHELRKDAKTLRYLIECFGSLVPDRQRRRFVRRLKALQDNLGVHQDAEVHLAVVRDVAGELRGGDADVDTLIAVGRLMERFEDIRGAARAEFAERFAAYDTRPTADALDELLDGLAP